MQARAGGWQLSLCRLTTAAPEHAGTGGGLAPACMHSKHLTSRLPLQVSDDRFLSLLAEATRLAEVAQQAKPQSRKPAVPHMSAAEAAAAKAQKQRHGQEVAEKASAKLALKARLGMQVGLPEPQQLRTHLAGRMVHCLERGGRKADTS